MNFDNSIFLPVFAPTEAIRTNADDAEKKEAEEQFKVVQSAMQFMMDNLCRPKLELNIRRHDSSVFKLEVRSSHTISDVKNELSEMECVSSDKQCVLYSMVNY